MRREPPFDVCIVGSGAAGGFVAKELTEAGARTVLLEAGREVRADELPARALPFELPARKSWDERNGLFYPDGISRELRPKGDPVEVDRIRVLGGRTVRWNANCFRFARGDFADWPLTYEEIEPCYRAVERTIGICGTREGMEVLPDSEYLGPPPAMRCSERIVRSACRTMGIRVVPTRKALATRPFGRRPPCRYCGHCMEGCPFGAIFTSANSLIPQAVATGRLTLRTGALASRIVVDREGRAAGVSFVDRTTGREEMVRARVVVVSCAAVESARLLLNSACEKHPNGLANSSDLVGRHLHGHSVTSFSGYATRLAGGEAIRQEGATDHAYIPRFRGAFGVQVQTAGFQYPEHAHHLPGFGAGWKRKIRRLHPAVIQMSAYARTEPRPGNRVTIERERRDRFGIPLPAVRFSFSDEDRSLHREVVATMEEIYGRIGVDLLFRRQDGIHGLGSHEVGTCRMGVDPKRSVLDPFCRTHDVPNLLVVDGSCFVSMPEKNPTLTIMALAVRASRHLAARVARREL